MIVERRGFRWKCKAIALFESRNIVENFLAGIADLEKIRFEQRDAIGKEFGQWAVEIFAKRGVCGVLEDVSELISDF